MHPHDPTTSPIWHPTPAERRAMREHARRLAGMEAPGAGLLTFWAAICLGLVIAGIWGGL